ncbi:MAG: hypothetical protein AMXMBFR12_09050 [Candidatus Babeliales bacterium]
MKNAYFLQSCFFLLVVCASPSILGDQSLRTIGQIKQDMIEAAPVVIDWMVKQMHSYPAVPGIITASLLCKAKESIMLKRPSFIVWAVLGAVVFAEPYRLFAQEYLAQRNAGTKDSGWTKELKEAQENAKSAGHAVVLAAQKGSQEAIEKSIRKD